MNTTSVIVNKTMENYGAELAEKMVARIVDTVDRLRKISANLRQCGSGSVR